MVYHDMHPVNHHAASSLGSQLGFASQLAPCIGLRLRAACRSETVSAVRLRSGLLHIGGSMPML